MRDPYDDALDSLEAAETQAPALQVASAAQPAEPDIYDAAFDKVEREEAEALRPMLDLATRTAPDVFASAQALAKSSGLPVELVERNLEEVKRAEQIKLASRVLEASPTLRRQMADPNFTRLAHEDVEQLGAIERIVKGAKEAGGSMVAGLYGASSGVVGVGQFAAEMAQYVTRPLHGALLPIDVGGAVADAARSYRRGIEAEAAQWRPERGGVLSQGWHSGLESLARNLPGLPLLFLPGGATASLTGMTLPVAGEEYGKARDRGLGVLEAGVFGASQGLVEYATERLPMTKLMGDIAAGTGLGKMLAKQFLYEAPTEQLATVLQDLNQWAAIDINEGKTFGDYVRERPEAAAVTLIATLVGTTGQTTIVHGMQKTLERLSGGQAEAEQSQRLADAARELAAASQALRLSQLSPDTVEEYLQQLTEGGPLEELYVGADVLEQLGLTQRMAEASPAIAEQLAAVGQDGGMIRITAAELAAKLGPAGLADPLFDHLRPGRPDAMSKLEAEEYLQTLGERMEEELSADLGDVDQRVADDFDLNAYRDYVVAQLQALGRPDLAPAYRAYGELQKAMIGALASRAGLTPRQLLERRGLLAITGEGQAAPERSPAQPTLEDLEQDYWDVRVEWERVNAEGGDIEAADAAVEAARRRVEEARRRSAQDAGGADASAAAGSQMGRARSALDEARSAFDLAYQAGEDLTGAMESIRAATADLAREIAAGYPDATGFLADRIDGGRIELEQVRDEGGQLIDSWVVTWRDEQGATERDDVFASREDALDAYLADAKLDGMEFFTLAAAESAPTPVSRLTELREAAEAAAAEVAAFEAATDQGQEIDPDAYWAATERQVEANRALGAELEALPDDGFALEAVTPGGMALSLTPSAQQPGKWQLTHFDQAGQPWGDTQYETKAEAIAELLTDADVSTVRDFGGQFNQRGGAPQLQAVHNLSAENLLFADELGGLAVPSVGVVRADAGAVDGFGEITLIGTRALVDPKRERAFAGDAYTARFPKPSWSKVKTKPADKIVESIREAADEFGDRTLVGQTWDALVNTPDAGELVELWLRSNAVRAMYLRERGIDAAPVMRDVPMRTPVPAGRLEELRPLFDAVNVDQGADVLDSPEWAALAEAYARIVGEAYAEKGRPDSLVAKLAEFNYRRHSELALDLKNAGKQEVDTWKTTEALSAAVDPMALDFKRWIEARVLPAFGEPFLLDGKKKKPYTLENIVASMTDKKVKGKETSATYGAGQAKAAVSVEFSDLEQMRAAAAESIVDPAEFEAARAQTDALLEAYRNAVAPFTTIRNWRGEPDVWEAMDASMRALARFSTGKKRDAAAMRQALKREEFDVAAISDEAIEQAIVAADALMRTPVPYFEAKPQRAVRLDEFAGAVIPDNAPAEVRAILDRHGLPVREYAAEGDRTAAVRAFAAELNASGAETLFQGATPIGGYVPATNTMRMLKSANLSTFLHETGHMGLEMMIDLAGSISSYPADQLSEGEKGILRDVNAVLAWFGVRDLAEWSAMSFQEKRGYHEKFAESFERYLLDGKAPSIELQPFFGRFRRWMLDVYKSVKAFLQKNPDAGELSAEVRQVFDRMLATDEQIDTMRRLGTLSALFSSAEQAEALGIQIEDWDAYQALASGQIDEAKELMSARALKDMKWLSRARSRELRKLQKEAALLRAGVEMEVRPDVLRRPIYRAWQFLTARMGEDDRLPNIERPKSDPDVVDPALDSLFVAIAKLGGIDRAELESEWGLDPKEKIPQAGFGKHVLRRTDGRSIDEMRALLVQYGYLDPNDTGPDWNPREFEERFFEELNGSAQYSSAADFDALQDIRPGDQVINLAGLSAGRFDAAALQSMGLPADVLERMRKLRMTSSNGLHPDIVADMLVDPDGVAIFESGDQLVRELAAAATPSEQIAAEVDAIMLERHGEFATREALEDAVDAAVHNNLRLRLIATQYAALTKARGDVDLIQRAARDVAKRMVSRQAIKALRPDLFRAAEARAAKASERAIQAGDVETAAKEQRNQLVNAYAVREALKAKEDIAKTIKAWKELVGRSDKRAVKSYDVDVLNAVRVILGAYGIGGKQAEKAGEYLERVKAYDPELYAVLNDYASRLAAADMVKPVGELKIEQFEELKEGIGAMLELARSSRTAEIGGDTMDIADIQAELLAKAEENGIPDRIPGEGMAVTPGEAKLQKLKSALAAATRMEQWVDMFDAVTGVGPARRYLFMHVNSAANNYRADKVKYLRKFRELIDPIASTLEPKLIHSDELGYTFGKDTGGSAMNEILHALLHTGNSSNKRKLLLGRKWAKEVAPDVIDTSAWDAFLRRMADEGHITKAHMDFVQGVWDLLEETKPLAQKTHRQIFGHYFAEITAEPVSTPWGVYRGGYVPAVVDVRANTDAALRAMAEDETQSMQFGFPSPASGFTKSRVKYDAHLLLDLRSLTQHIDKVLMFAHMAKPVRDVKRMIGGDFGKALGRINPAIIPGVVTPFLNRSAKQIVATPIPGDGGLMGFFATLRSRAGMAAMIANLTNTAQQVTGFSLSALKVKPTLMLSAASQFVQSPREFIASVTSASIAMDHRFNNSGALVGDQISEILLNPSLLERGQAFGMRHAYFMQAGVDAVMSSIIWTAAYNQAVERGSPHDDAVALADSTIRTTQGSMLPEDLARFEAGNHFVRLFTQFAGYFNMQANLITSELVKRGRSIKREGWTKDNVAGVSKVLLLAFLIPAVVAELIVQAFRGGPDDEDKDGEYLDDWLAYAGMGVIRNATAMVPVVGQLANAIYSRTNSKPYDDRVGTNPAFSMIESAASAPFSIAKAVADDGSSQKAIRETGIAISMILGLPVTPLTKPLGYAAAVEEGRVDPTSAGDYARGLVTGVASPESK